MLQGLDLHVNMHFLCVSFHAFCSFVCLVKPLQIKAGVRHSEADKHDLDGPDVLQEVLHSFATPCTLVLCT